MFLLVIKDKARLCECHTPPPGPPLFSYQIKGEMNSHGRKPYITSSPLSSQSTQQLQHIQRGKALWKSVQGAEGWGKEGRGWFAVAEQEKRHTPAQHELFAEISNNSINQLFLILLMFKRNKSSFKKLITSNSSSSTISLKSNALQLD